MTTVGRPLGLDDLSRPADPISALQEDTMTETDEAALFEGDPGAWQIQLRILQAFDDLADIEVRESASQIAYRHGRTFAIVWRPGRYLRSEVPVVLSLVLREPLASARFKEVVQVTGDAWMHHLELRSAAEVDDEVRGWIRFAWEGADRRVSHAAAGREWREHR